FCYFLNESPIAVSRCRRCQKPLRNPNDSEQLYQQIVAHLEDHMESLESFAEELEQTLAQSDQRDAADSFDEDEEDREAEQSEMQGVIDEVLPLNGLSVVW